MVVSCCITRQRKLSKTRPNLGENTDQHSRVTAQTFPVRLPSDTHARCGGPAKSHDCEVVFCKVICVLCIRSTQSLPPLSLRY